MAFMKPVVYKGEYYEVEANHGETHIIPGEFAKPGSPASALADYVDGTIDNPDTVLVRQTGWLARMSAPGYMDCTDWTVHVSEHEAEAYLAESYGGFDESDTE